MDDAKTFQKIQSGDYVVPLKEACERNGQYSESYQIGFPIFDNSMKIGTEIQGGIRDGDLVIITGRSGEGKTTFAQNIALNLNNLGLPSLFFSYEVMPDNIYAKFKAMGFKDDGVLFAPKKLITGNLKWVKEKIIEAQEKYFVKIVILDHIDFLAPSDSNSSDQLRMRLKNITQELKSIALDRKVIIFLLAHVKKVDGREVEMQDISESSGIYNLSDFVFSVARSNEVLGNERSNQGKIRLLKNRLTGKCPFMEVQIINNRIYKC